MEERRKMITVAGICFYEGSVYVCLPHGIMYVWGESLWYGGSASRLEIDVELDY